MTLLTVEPPLPPVFGWDDGWLEDRATAAAAGAGELAAGLAP